MCVPVEIFFYLEIYIEERVKEGKAVLHDNNLDCCNLVYKRKRSASFEDSNKI